MKKRKSPAGPDSHIPYDKQSPAPTPDPALDAVLKSPATAETLLQTILTLVQTECTRFLAAGVPLEPKEWDQVLRAFEFVDAHLRGKTDAGLAALAARTRNREIPPAEFKEILRVVMGELQAQGKAEVQ